MNGITKSPLAIGALIFVTILIITVFFLMGRRPVTSHDGETVKVDIDKLKQQIRTEGVGRR